MELILSMAVRNLGRNRRRTLLTALTVAIGVALLTIAMSFVGGVFWAALEKVSAMAGEVRVVTPRYAQRDQLMPLSENMPETAALEAAIRASEGVTAVYPHIALGVTGAVGDDEIGERFGLLHGAPMEFYTEHLDLDAYLLEGTMPSFGGEDWASVGARPKFPVYALVGRQFAEEVGARAGTEVILTGQRQDGSPSGMRIQVAGVVDLGNSAQNRQLWVSLDAARWMTEIPAGATELMVFGDDWESAPDLAASLRDEAALSGLDVRAWSERPPYDGFVSFARVLHAIAGGVIVFITALGVLNTMFMSVLERTAEIGVMRAMGLRAWQSVVLFVVEAMAIATVGGAVGVLVGAPVALYLGHHGIDFGAAVDKLPPTIPINTIVRPVLDWNVAIMGVVLGYAMALVGGALPAWRASQIQPVEAMRSRR
ncbi:MAG: ABC transporter permease [Deltaproteobacteria bacterium]|nr:ABC transporter permease [Deltaproteobacteria bacterium]